MNFRTILILGVAIIEVVQLYRLFREVYLEILLEDSGITTKGRVMALVIQRTFDRRNNFFYAMYRFSLEEATYEQSQQINHGKFMQLRPGTSVDIKYLSHNPTISRLSGDSQDHAHRNYLALHCIIGLIPLVALLAS